MNRRLRLGTEHIPASTVGPQAWCCPPTQLLVRLGAVFCCDPGVIFGVFIGETRSLSSVYVQRAIVRNKIEPNMTHVLNMLIIIK